MELVYEKQVIQFAAMPTVDAVMEKIAEMLGEEKWFSHFIVNQTEIYEEPESYLSEHLNQINRIEMKGKDISEFMNDVLLSALEYSQRAIGILPCLAFSFRQYSINEAFHDFYYMLEGMEWLHQVFTVMDNVPIEMEKKNEFKVIGVYLEILVQKLNDALAMQNYALIAKIIEKELISVYESIVNINQVLYISQNVEDWH